MRRLGFLLVARRELEAEVVLVVLDAGDLVLLLREERGSGVFFRLQSERVGHFPHSD